MTEMPFTIKVYDKNFNFMAFVGDPISLTVTPRFNQTGTGTLVVDLNHHAAPYLLADGARLVIFHNGDQMLSGKIHQRSAEGPTIDGTLTLTFRDDYRLLYQVLGWPRPALAIAGQTGQTMYLSGNPEQIVKNLVQQNMIDRLDLPVSCAPNLLRGTVIPPAQALEFRFHPLYEKLFPAIEQAGLGVTFQQGPDGSATIVCDVFTPPVYPHTLTEESGILQSWSWSSRDYTATRVVVGDSGTAEERNYIEMVDGTLESAHNDVFEIITNARSIQEGEVESAVMAASGQEALDEATATSGFAVQLSETGTFRYGQNNLVVGALVTISVGGVTRTDFLREVTLSYTRDEGVITTPVVGEISDSPDRILAKFLARLKKGLNDLKVSK